MPLPPTTQIAAFVLDGSVAAHVLDDRSLPRDETPIGTPCGPERSLLVLLDSNGEIANYRHADAWIPAEVIRNGNRYIGMAQVESSQMSTSARTTEVVFRTHNHAYAQQ